MQMVVHGVIEWVDFNTPHLSRESASGVVEALAHHEARGNRSKAMPEKDHLDLEAQHFRQRYLAESSASA